MTVACSATTFPPPESPDGGLAPPHAARRRGNPKGNPGLNLSPRCGARTRAGCACQAPAIRGKLRCRMHGGRSTGPRTPEGLARLRAARTLHGRHGAKARAYRRWKVTLLHRVRVAIDLSRYERWLPPALAARARHEYLPELTAPPPPAGGISAAEGRALRQSVDAALAPWQQAIAAARAAVRAERDAARAGRVKALAPVRRRRVAAAPRLGAEGLLAAVLAGLHAPVLGHGQADGAGAGALASPGVGAVGRRHGFVPEVHAPVLGQGYAGGAGPHALPSADAGATGWWQGSVPEVHAPVLGQGYAGGTGPHALPSADAGVTGWRQGSVPEVHAAVLGQSAADGAGARTVASPDAGARERQRDALSEAHAPVAAPPKRDAVPPGLPNRAARRRWKWEQHQARKLAGGRAVG